MIRIINLFRYLITAISAWTLTIPLQADVNPDELMYNLIDGNYYSVSKGYYFYDYEGELVIPPTHKGLPVAEIAPSGFWGCSKITSITLPESLQVIGESAFKHTGISEITIPSNVYSIGKEAFEDCESLTTVRFTEPQEVQEVSVELGNAVFNRCKALRQVTLPKTMTIIPSSTFSQCSSLKDVKLPEPLTTIGNSAFWHCTSLTNIQFPGTLSTIGRSAFSGCTGLKEITFSDILLTNISIDDYAFSETGLTSIVCPRTLISIGEFAFSDCEDLQSVVLPETMTTIKHATFSNSGLTSVILPKVLREIGTFAFFGCRYLREIILPESLISIGESAFSGTGLTKVVFPETVEIISGFNSCPDLTFIEIGSNVNIIENRTFYNSYLQEIICHAIVPPLIKWDTFENDTYSDAILHVPEAAIDSYQHDKEWSNFRYIQNITSGIEHHIADECTNRTAYYSLDGIWLSDVADSLLPGIYIEVKNGTASKIRIK